MLSEIIGGVGALAGIAGNIWSNSKSSKARREQQKLIDEENKRNENWFNGEYYKSQLDRTENAHALQKAQDFFKDRANIDAKTAAVTGATPESVAASKKAYSGAYSDLVSNIASGASAQRDRIKQIYDANKNNIFGIRSNLLDNQVSQYGNLSNSFGNLTASSLSSLASSLDNSGSKKINWDSPNLKSSYSDYMKNNAIFN